MELAFDRGGTGKPLLLIHGTASDRAVWAPLRPALEAEREVVAVDLPGHGASPTPPGTEPITPAAFASSVAVLMDGLGWDRAHLAGNSLGGWVALELALLGRARSVTALSPAGFWTPREHLYVKRSILFGRRAGRRLRPLMPALVASAAGRTALYWQFLGKPWQWPAEAVAGVARAAAACRVPERTLDGERGRFTGGERLADLPVTVAWGELDRLLPRARQAPRAARALPRARHVTLDGCGHVPTWDDPAQVAGVLLEGSGGPAAPG